MAFIKCFYSMSSGNMFAL